MNYSKLVNKSIAELGDQEVRESLRPKTGQEIQDWNESGKPALYRYRISLLIDDRLQEGKQHIETMESLQATLRAYIEHRITFQVNFF